jgi:hypothetical protein
VLERSEMISDPVAIAIIMIMGRWILFDVIKSKFIGTG